MAFPAQDRGFDERRLLEIEVYRFGRAQRERVFGHGRVIALKGPWLEFETS
jgi:hypothetical protein